MAIHLDYYNVIIPLSVIGQRLANHEPATNFNIQKMFAGGKIYIDDYLYRDGAMSPSDLDVIVAYWVAQGFELFEEKEGKKHWKDMCVIDMFGYSEHPCDWLVVETGLQDAGSFVYTYLKGKPKGLLVSAKEPLNNTVM